ncbi:MAG: porin family protein [Burkholderiales bacterium]|nr:porin family protein [Burkholderiales bacterium]
MKKILAVLLATTSIAAFADNDLYFGGGAGATWNKVNTAGFAVRLNGGYNFDDYLAVELGTTNIAQAGSGELNQNLQFWDLSIKGTMPLGETIGLFGQVGGAYGIPGFTAAPSGNNETIAIDNPTIAQDAWDILAAAGVQYNLTKKTAVTLTDYYYFGSTQYQGNTNVVLAGLKYNF